MIAIKLNSCLLLCALAGAVSAQDPEPTKKVDVVRAVVKNPKVGAAAKAALDAAKGLGKQIKGLRGPARLAAIEAAAVAYESVASEFATDRAAVAVAGFEAGELWRRQGTLGKAETCYKRALEADDGRFRERCLFQIGQMLRRTKQYDKAILSYAAAAKVSPQSNRAHEARLWCARTLQTKGETDQALESFRAAVKAAVRPRQVIIASNYLAKALLAKSDLDGAGAAIAHAEDVVGKAIGQGGPDSARLQKLVESMSVRRAYQHALDKARGTAADAAQLEKDRAIKQKK